MVHGCNCVLRGREPRSAESTGVGALATVALNPDLEGAVWLVYDELHRTAGGGGGPDGRGNSVDH